MIITYLRSSSYNAYDFCQMRYFLEYVLGIPQQENFKAIKGTICHKVFECLAKIKQAKQNNPKVKYITDDQIGRIYIGEDWKESDKLTKDEILSINKTRINQYNYAVPCKLKIGHKRIGVKLVEELIQRAYDYYSDPERTPHRWMPVDFKDCTNWVWMTLDYQDGKFDPRNREIFEPEQHFDFEIDEPWAKYKYTLADGTVISGNLAIKGTIDLITLTKFGIIEVVDWKTGARRDWNKGVDKSYELLMEDPQLMLYYMAVRHLYPDKEIILTIFFSRSGGPFSLCFDDDTIDEFKKMLQKRFEEIRDCVDPKMISPNHTDMKCYKMCHYYKNNYPDTNKTICDHIGDQIDIIGIDETIKQFTDPDHNVDNYEAPGE